MLGRKRFEPASPSLSRFSSYFVQDFEAARKKALNVGAKKFFLEVGLHARTSIKTFFTKVP
jgi:hypothetical protein